MSSWLDHLPSNERSKIRKRLRSPEAYERLREKVKGPEDLEREMEKMEALAELTLSMEMTPGMKENVKESISEDLKEQGIENVLEAGDLPLESQDAILSGNFEISVESHPESQEDCLSLLPNGNVAEKIPITKKRV